MTRELDALAREVAWPVPPDLAAVAARLEDSQWPEVVGRWSRLTPTGFPVELTFSPGETVRRWTSEIAGPEIADTRRLGMVASHLACAGQPVSASLLEQLESVQARGILRYGAWLGGRSDGETAPRFKLYAEVPRGIPLDGVALPAALRAVIARAPMGTHTFMVGIEPARRRTEVYLGLTGLTPENLRPMLHAAGQIHGLDALDQCLPDGIRRFAGRRLGLSVAVAPDSMPEITIGVSARSLFPGSPAMLATLVPAVAAIPQRAVRPTLVTMRLTPGREQVGFAVGVTFRWPMRATHTSVGSQ